MVSTTTASYTKSKANLRKAVTAATVGTVIEWYDYALYGAASGLVINKLFFPNLSPVNGVLAAFATFAVGFFIRPLGGSSSLTSATGLDESRPCS